MRWDWHSIITETITATACVPLAFLLMVVVSDGRWPTGWLVIAGVLTAWAGDSLAKLGSHLRSVLVARRHHRHDEAPQATPQADRADDGAIPGSPQ